MDMLKKFVLAFCQLCCFLGTRPARVLKTSEYTTFLCHLIPYCYEIWSGNTQKRIKHWILQVIHIIVSYINWYKFICSGLLAFDFTVATIYWMSLCPFRVLKLFSFDIWTRLARIKDFLREFQEKCLFLKIVQSLVLVTMNLNNYQFAG